MASTAHDVTLPEVRSTALAPLMAGLTAVRSPLHTAILLICVSAWVVCSILFAFAACLVPRDIEALRRAMRERERLIFQKSTINEDGTILLREEKAPYSAGSKNSA